MNLRNVYPKRVGPTPLTESAVSIFLADKRYIIERFTLSNVTATDDTADVYVVTSGGSASISNAVCYQLDIPANDLMTVPCPIVLETGDPIYALCATAASVNIMFNVNDVEYGVQ